MSGYSPAIDLLVIGIPTATVFGAIASIWVCEWIGEKDDA